VDYLAPDFSSAALVTIDTQVDTLDDQPLEVPGTSGAVPEIASLAAVFRDAGRPIVHVVRLYRGDGSNVDLCRRSAVEAGAKILAPGSSGSQLAPGIVERPGSFTLDAPELLGGRPQEVGPREVVMYKPRWGGRSTRPRWKTTCGGTGSPPLSSAAATSRTARARRSTKPASATFASCSPRMRSQAFTRRAVRNSRTSVFG